MVTHKDRTVKKALSFCSLIQLYDLKDETKITYSRMLKEFRYDSQIAVFNNNYTKLNLPSGATKKPSIPVIIINGPTYPGHIVSKAQPAVPRVDEINADEIPIEELRILIYIHYGTMIPQGSRQSLKTAFHSLKEHNYYKAKKVAMKGQKINKKDGWIFS